MNKFTLFPDESEPSAKETSESIQQQIDKFLSHGGDINQVESGISGLESVATQQPKSMLKKTTKKNKNSSS